MLEEACLSLGFSLQSAHLLFELLDARKKGFITTSEWGNCELAQTIETFSLMYLRRFLGLPDVHASPVEVGHVLVCSGMLAQGAAVCAVYKVRVCVMVGHTMHKAGMQQTAQPNRPFCF